MSKKEFSVGDTVVLHLRFSKSLHEVIRKTKAGNFEISGCSFLFNPQGKMRGSSGYGSLWVNHATARDVEEIKHAQRVAWLSSIKFGALEVEQVKRLYEHAKEVVK